MSTTIADAAIFSVRIFQRVFPFVARGASVTTVALALWAATTQLFDKLVIAADQIVSLTFSSVSLQPLAFVNFIFPLTEFMAFLSGYLALILACATVRIVKSFIPTISG